MVLRIPASLWEASKGWTTFVGILALYLAATPKLQEWGLSLFGNISPLWALAPVGFLFLLGLMRAPFEEYQRLQEEKEGIERRLATDEKQVALKDLLGIAYENGIEVSGGGVSKEDRQRWVDETQRLIEAAFGKGQAQIFLINSGITYENLFGYTPSNPLAQVIPSSDVAWIPARLRRLDELIASADSLPMRPDFNPRDWDT